MTDCLDQISADAARDRADYETDRLSIHDETNTDNIPADDGNNADAWW
jgi:hypothetical protein